MKKHKLILSISAILITIIFIICSGILSTAINTIHFDELDESNKPKIQFCSEKPVLLSTKDKSAYFFNIYGEFQKVEIQCEKKLLFDYKTDYGYICVSEPEFIDNNYQYNFYFYDTNLLLINHLQLIFDTIITDAQFAMDNEANFYIINTKDSHSLACFSKAGNLVHTYTTEDNFEQIFYFQGNIYALINQKLYIKTDDNFQCIYNKTPITYPVSVTSTTNFSDYTGKLFQIENNEINLLSDFRLENTAAIASDKFFLAYENNKLFGTDKLNSHITATLDLKINIETLFAYNHEIYAGGFSENGYEIYRITDNELNTQEETIPTVMPTSQPETKFTESTTSTGKINIYSTTYTIDNYMITDISSKTTVSQFKDNLTCENCSVKIISENGQEKSSGNIGTGMSAIFSNQNESLTYRLAVKGDLTGEGNINSLDVNKMFNFLLEKENYNDLLLNAGDMNNDQKLSNIDLLLLSQSQN